LPAQIFDAGSGSFFHFLILGIAQHLPDDIRDSGDVGVFSLDSVGVDLRATNNADYQRSKDPASGSVSGITPRS